MKNRSNTGNSKGAVSRICAFALGLMLATSLPAGAVTGKVPPTGDYSPGTSVIFSSQAGVGFAGNSIDYMSVNGITIYAAPRNGSPNWSPFQQLQINWTLYYYDSTTGQWNTGRYMSCSNDGPNSTAYVGYYGGYPAYPAYFRYGACTIQAAPGYLYTFVVNVRWIKAGTNLPMANAFYVFDQLGDLQCLGSNCSRAAYPALNLNISGQSLPKPAPVQVLWFSR